MPKEMFPSSYQCDCGHRFLRKHYPRNQSDEPQQKDAPGRLGPSMLILETPRLILRPFQDSDLESFAAYRSDPEVERYQGWEAPYSVDKAAEFIAEMKHKQPAIQGEWYQLAIELIHGIHLIGDCAFHILADDSRQAEIGFTLARKYQGYGYATEAVTRLLDYMFRDLDLHRVMATCDVENLASARLLERVGMWREGHFVENIWFKGNWGSEYLYALLQREWTFQKGQKLELC